MADPENGRFYASGREVWRSSVKTKIEGGHSYTLGFKVCTVSDFVKDGTAEAIADALNSKLDSGAIT